MSFLSLKGGPTLSRSMGGGPVLSLPFYTMTPAEIAAAGVTFSRAGSADYLDNSDSIQSASENIPRVNHHVWDGFTLSNYGLIYEVDGSTNYVSESDDLNTTWALTACTFSGGILTSTGGGFARYSTSSLADNTVYAFESEIKRGSLSWVRCFIRNKASSDSSAYINLATGDIGTTSGTATWSTTLHNGYIRIVGVFDSGAGATTPFIQIQFATDNNSTGASSGDTIYVRRVEIKPESLASSFILTDGGTDTRGAESLSFDPPYSASGVWGAIKGAETYLDAGSAAQETLFDWRVDANNRITVTLDTDGIKAGDITLTSVIGGVSSSVAVEALTPGRYQPFEVAWRVSSDTINIALNGYAETEVAVSGIPDLSSATATLGGNGTRYSARFGVGAINDAQLQIYAGEPTETHVILLAGQSNMAGRATYDSLGGHPDFVSQWNQSAALVDASVPLDHPSQPVGTMGPDITFATRYRLANPAANLVFVPCAVGSTSFDNGDWNPGDTYYNAAVARTLAALASTGGTLTAVLWVQGENDAIAGVTQSAYAAYLDAMITAFRSDIGTCPFIVGQISPALNPATFLTFAEINAAIADTPNRVTNSAYASSAGLVILPDGVHYSAANLRTLGSRLFDALASM